MKHYVVSIRNFASGGSLQEVRLSCKKEPSFAFVEKYLCKHGYDFFAIKMITEIVPDGTFNNKMKGRNKYDGNYSCRGCSR